MTETPMTDSAPPHAGSRIEVSQLTKRFGALVAVDHLDLTVEPGRLTGFLGPNGAGKTTTLRMLLGLVEAPSLPSLPALSSLPMIWDRSARGLPDCPSPCSYPMMDQIIASHGLLLAGTPGSTFSAIIRHTRRARLATALPPPS